MLRSINDRVSGFRAESARFAPPEHVSSSSTRSRSTRWQDDTGLRSWTNAPREANERRDVAAGMLVSASSKNTVRLENLGLTELPPKQHLASLDKATTLSLAGNNLTTIASSVLGLRNLQHLNVSHNLLREIPPGIGQLVNLRTLDASHTGLDWVPSQIGNLSKLKTLDLSHNAVESLPAEIGNLSRLETLRLNANLLRQRDPAPDFEEQPVPEGSQKPGLPPQIRHLKKLRELDLSSNHFQRMPEEIGQITGLQILNFRHNALTDTANANAIPESVANLKKLASFDVSDNTNLGLLPRDFGPLEYRSKRRQLLTRQRSQSGAMSFLSRKFSMSKLRGEAQAAADITIAVKNTAVPFELTPDRLPTLTGSNIPSPLQPKPLYVPPNFSRPREDVSLRETERGPVGDQSGGLAPPVPHAAPAMLPPVLQAVLPYGGMQPNANAGDIHPIQLLLQQTTSQMAPPQLQPTVIPPPLAPARPGSPGAQSDTSNDSFASTTEDFVSVPRPEPSSRRSRSRQADAFPNVDSSTSHRIAKQSTSVSTQSHPVQPSVAAFSGERNPQPMTTVVPSTAELATIPQDVLHQLSQLFLATHGTGVTHAPLTHTMAPTVAPTRADPANFSGGIRPQQPKMTVPYGMHFGNGPTQTNAFGMQHPGLGATSAMQNPMFSGLLGKIAAGSAQPAYSSQPLFGLPQNIAQGRQTRSDYSSAQLVSPAQAAFERQAIASIQATRLKGMAEARPIELKGKALEHCVEEAKQGRLFGQSVGMSRPKILSTLGHIIYRQKFINDLAKAVAESNADRKKNSPDPMDAFLVDDPKQVAVVYQTLVSKELGIHGFEDWRSKLDNDNEEYQGIFGKVVAPANFDNLRNQLINAVFEDEAQTGGTTVAGFVEKQGFWKQFLNEVRQAEKTSNQTMYGY